MALPRPAADPFAQLRDPGELFKNPEQASFIRNLIGILRTTVSASLSRESASPSMMLQAPGGKVYRVVVADDGTLSTSFVSQAKV